MSGILDTFAIRPACPGDMGFIHSTWTNAESRATGHVDRANFGRWQRHMQNDIMARKTTIASVAGPCDDVDGIVGWAVYALLPARVLYYVYVREEARRMGLAKELLAPLKGRTIYTTRPARVQTVSGWVESPIRPPNGWIYMPRAAFYELEDK